MAILGDYIRIKHGFAFKGDFITTEDNGVVLVTPGNFEIGGGFKEKKCKFFSNDYPSDYVLHPGDLIVTMTDLSKQGDTLGFSALVPNSKRTYLHNQRIGLVDVLNPKADKGYIYWFMRTPRYQKTIVATSSGSTVKHTSPSRICEVEIDLPPLNEQKAIAAILSSIEQKIQNNDSINDNLQQQAYAYFLQLFIENADPSWHVGTIADLGMVVGGGTPSKAKPEYYTDDGIAWITPKDLSIDKSKFIAHGENDISELGYRNSSATMMPAGTVLFSSRAPIGYIAIASNEVTTNQGFKSVVPHPEIGTPFVYYFLIHNLPLIESKASGSTFKEVSGSVMNSVEAVIPDGNTIAKFNDFCRPVFEMQEKLEQENRKLAAMRDSLLPRLMSGEIDVADIGI